MVVEVIVGAVVATQEIGIVAAVRAQGKRGLGDWQVVVL